MYNAFPYYFLSELQNRKGSLSLPTQFKEISRKNEIENYDKLFSLFENELENSPIQTIEQSNYFFFILQNTFKAYFLELKNAGFYELIELVKHRMTAFRQLSTSTERIASWDQYVALCTQAFERNMKYISLEQFESYIDQLDWGSFQKEILADVSSVIGLTYLNESQNAQLQKSRIWLTKSVQESQGESQVVINQMNLASYYFSQKPENWEQHVDQIHHLISQTEATDTLSQQLIQSALEILDFQKQLCHWESKAATVSDIGPFIQKVQQLENKFEEEAFTASLPSFASVELRLILSAMYEKLFLQTEDSLEKETFSEKALKYLETAIDETEKLKHTHGTTRLKLEKIRLTGVFGIASTEKESKEVIQFYKKGRNYAGYTNASAAFAEVLALNKNGEKSFDLIEDIFKMGLKRIEEGGFNLICQGLSLANDVFLKEAAQPGVSWMIHYLDKAFEYIAQAIDLVDQHSDTIGKQAFDVFRKEYIRFQPVSNFNIKVYYRYQLYSLYLIQKGAVIHQQAGNQELVSMLINQLNDQNNPLSFMDAEWDEFKNVPNSVRNKTINKCISISKGDLPLAAEHLEFSYRNLRSYITFNEVNRLGFFLDMQQTDNKQLEQGIRYMFYDLYKDGTIFEVVFDMPKFLVNHASSGFFSQDLERELNIKGTTAKKYIKIMINIGLIRQDKAMGRKHYYRLIRENVMKRLGSDQNTLIKEE